MFHLFQLKYYSQPWEIALQVTLHKILPITKNPIHSRHSFRLRTFIIVVHVASLLSLERKTGNGKNMWS